MSDEKREPTDVGEVRGPATRVAIERARDGRPPRGRDWVATEEPLEIRVAWTPTGAQEPLEHPLTVTMRTPGDDFDLAVGFLYSEGIITSGDDVVRVSHCVQAPGLPPGSPQLFNIVTVDLRPGVSFDPSQFTRNFLTNSSCGVCGKASLEALRDDGLSEVAAEESPLTAAQLRKLPDLLRDAQPLFEKTGGIHASGLFRRDGTLELVREDVGRHNALDKVIGAWLTRGEPAAESAVLVVSGRLSYELVQKAARARWPIVVAVGAPSSLAIETAEEFGITLLGFTNSGGFNLYTHPGRVDRS